MLDLENAYELSDHNLRLRNVRIGIILYLALMPSFGYLDWIVYNHRFFELIKIRLYIGIVFVALYLITHTKFSRNIKFLGISGAILAGLPLSWMVMITDGAASPYYAGLNLVIVVMSVLLPWVVTETAIVCLLTVGIYTVACIGNSAIASIPFDTTMFLNNVYFLVSTSIICIVASHYQSKRRIEIFQLNYELDFKNKELEQLDQMKSQFFANISHELRTPLTLILGPIQDLLNSRANLPDHVASLLHTARDNSLRLLKLVNDLLDLIRFEESHNKLDLYPVELNMLLRGLTNSVQHLAESRNINLRSGAFEKELYVNANSAALERVFLNLFSNAIKFTPQGGEITVECEHSDDLAVVRLEDTGIGIDQNELPFIFDRFRQADNSSTRKYTGTGIGLSLVKQLVEKMSGSIMVDSVAGSGTCITVKIPIMQSGFTSQTENVSEDNDSLEQLHRTAERISVITPEEPEDYFPIDEDNAFPRVLLVEDEPAMRRYLGDMLSKQYQVILARDGRRGLELAREIKPELMVLDLMLPKMNGLEVCKLLKHDESTRGIKIVLLTARVDEEAKLTALRNGADDFLTKPFGKVELETRLQNLLKTQTLENDLTERNHSLSKTLEKLKETQAQLTHSEKLNAIGSLSAGLLHEVNNPLNYVIAAIQLLKEESIYAKDESIKETIDDISEGVSRIKAIASDLHTFAHPSEADKLTSFHFEKAITSALRFTAYDTKGINVIHNLEYPDLIIGSHSHIVQILVNLISNAVKSIENKESDSKGEIRISSYTRKNRYYVEVRDNGVGIDKNTMRKIFDPFFTTRQVGQGMGLGLSICHTIVESHGGRLTVNSKLGEWTQFTFDFSVAE